MNETLSREQQLFGQADATAMRPLEAVNSDEIVATLEQQEIADVMRQEGKLLETAVLDARERAAARLQRLQGKELVRAGVTMMGRGVWESVKAEANGLIRGGLFGAVYGGIGGATLGLLARQPPEGIARAAAAGGMAGGVG